MSISDYIIKTYSEYIQGKKDITITPYEPSGETDVVYASDIGLCPLAAALKRHGVPPLYPQLMPSLQERHRMIMGVYMARPLQEALSAEHPVEVRVKHPTLPIVGRIDALVTLDGETYVVEIKSMMEKLAREKMKFPGFTVVKPQHVFQTYAYMTIVNAKGVIAYISRDEIGMFVNVYRDGDTLVAAGDGVYQTYNISLYNEALERLINYHTGAAKNPPIDALNDRERGWQCGKLVKPNSKTPGKFIPACPWFCHKENANSATVVEFSGNLFFEDDVF